MNFHDWIVHIHMCTCKKIPVNTETSRSCGNPIQVEPGKPGAEVIQCMYTHIHVYARNAESA